MEYLLTKINKKRCLYAKAMVKTLFDDSSLQIFNHISAKNQSKYILTVIIYYIILRLHAVMYTYEMLNSVFYFAGKIFIKTLHNGFRYRKTAKIYLPPACYFLHHKIIDNLLNYIVH